jgi:hypothetical protein
LSVGQDPHGRTCVRACTCVRRRRRRPTGSAAAAAAATAFDRLRRRRRRYARSVGRSTAVDDSLLYARTYATRPGSRRPSVFFGTTRRRRTRDGRRRVSLAAAHTARAYVYHTRVRCAPAFGWGRRGATVPVSAARRAAGDDRGLGVDRVVFFFFKITRGCRYGDPCKNFPGCAATGILVKIFPGVPLRGCTRPCGRAHRPVYAVGR